MLIKTKSISRKLWFCLLLLAGFGIASAAGRFFVNVFLSPAKALPVYGQVSAFTLKDQNGENFNSTDLTGKVWIADFIFTRCAGPCPLMSLRMAKLQKLLGTSSEIRFVSFSVDPEWDTPEILFQYAKRFGADQASWHFLTGDKNTIHRLARNDFYLAVSEIPLDDQEAVLSLTHSTKFVLVDPIGRVRGFYDGQGKSPLDNLIRDAKILVKSGSKYPR